MLNFLYEIEFNSDELYDNTIDYTDDSTNMFDTPMKKPRSSTLQIYL